MKPIIIPIVILGLILFASSCKKDDPSQTKTTSSISSEDMRLYQKIQNFKEKGKSQLKDGEEMTTDEAIWYLEATANCTYGDASQETIETEKAVTYVTLNLNGQMVDLNEVWTNYELMIDDIRAHYLAINSTEKQLMSVNVEPQDITSTSITCKVISTFATGGYYPYACSFGPTDNWKPFGAPWVGGTCSGQYPEKDASTEIQRKIMYCKAVPTGYYWYEDPVTLDVLGHETHIPGFQGNPNYGGTYIYLNSDQYPGYQHCLNADELNFYLEGTKHIIYDTEAQGGKRPVGKSFNIVTMTWDLIPGSYESITEHIATIEWGILHVSPNPPEPLD